MTTATISDTLSRYVIRDRDIGVEHPIHARDLQHAKDLGVAWLSSGGYDTCRGTVWVDGSIFDEDGDEVARVTATIDPPEPRCTMAEHDWQSPHEIVGGIAENPGVLGHGGGVLITEVCMHCGCARETDTWAQRPDTAEEGLRSVSYDVGRYKDEVVALCDCEVEA